MKQSHCGGGRGLGWKRKVTGVVGKKEREYRVSKRVSVAWRLGRKECRAEGRRMSEEDHLYSCCQIGNILPQPHSCTTTLSNSHRNPRRWEGERDKRRRDEGRKEERSSSPESSSFLLASTLTLARNTTASIPPHYRLVVEQERRWGGRDGEGESVGSWREEKWVG